MLSAGVVIVKEKKHPAGPYSMFVQKETNDLLVAVMRNFRLFIWIETFYARLMTKSRCYFLQLWGEEPCSLVNFVLAQRIMFPKSSLKYITPGGSNQWLKLIIYILVSDVCQQWHSPHRWATWVKRKKFHPVQGFLSTQISYNNNAHFRKHFLRASISWIEVQETPA